MKALNLIIVLVCAHIANGQGEVSYKYEVNENKIFWEAKQEFRKFESEHGHFIKTPNAKVHYLTWGNPNDLPLIWSHGSFSNGYELLHVADNLVDAGYYIIAVDYYGHGQTSLPSHDVSLYHVADDIKFLMDHLKIDKAVIGGWSRGVQCAWFKSGFQLRLHHL